MWKSAASSQKPSFRRSFIVLANESRSALSVPSANWELRPYRDFDAARGHFPVQFKYQCSCACTRITLAETRANFRWRERPSYRPRLREPEFARYVFLLRFLSFFDINPIDINLMDGIDWNGVSEINRVVFLSTKFRDRERKKGKLMSTCVRNVCLYFFFFFFTFTHVFYI